jgi:hypothetical protein
VSRIKDNKLNRDQDGAQIKRRKQGRTNHTKDEDEYQTNKTKEGTTQLNMKNEMQKPRTSEQNRTKMAHRPQEGSINQKNLITIIIMEVFDRKYLVKYPSREIWLS